jgi:hypothetical protein
LVIIHICSYGYLRYHSELCLETLPVFIICYGYAVPEPKDKQQN